MCLWCAVFLCGVLLLCVFIGDICGGVCVSCVRCGVCVSCLMWCVFGACEGGVCVCDLCVVCVCVWVLCVCVCVVL